MSCMECRGTGIKTTGRGFSLLSVELCQCIRARIEQLEKRLKALEADHASPAVAAADATEAGEP